RVLRGRTDLFLFESAHARDVFNARVGAPTALARVVHNGVTTPEFEPVAPGVDATDLVFVGELRQLKGVDLLIEAIALLAAVSVPISGRMLLARDATLLPRAGCRVLAYPVAGRITPTLLSHQVRDAFDIVFMTHGVLAAYRVAIG